MTAFPQTLPSLENQLRGELLADGLPRNAYTVALAASLVVKSGPGTLGGFSVLSTNAASQFIQVFDLGSLPADGAIPVAVFTVAASSNLGVQYAPFGRFFRQGIVICNSSTAATKTIGSADCWFDAQYI